MTDTQTMGSCLCGKVSLVLDTSEEPRIDVCHCATCRKWGGGPFLGLMDAQVAVSGEDHVVAYPSSDWAERAFCGSCGSHLWYTFLPTGHRSVLAGLFDLPHAEIEQQIFVDEKPTYYDFAQQTPMKTGAQIVAEAEAAGFSFDE